MNVSQINVLNKITMGVAGAIHCVSSFIGSRVSSARGRGTSGVSVARFASVLAMLSALWFSPVNAQEHPAQEIVETSVNEFLTVVRDNEERVATDRQFLVDQIETIIVPHLDFETMTKLSVGKYWRSASQDQRVALVAEFKMFLLNTYISAVEEYKDGDVSFEKFRPESREDRAVVRSGFSQPGSSDVPVLYKLRDREGWRIYDIEVDGLSLVTNYRNSFANEINRNGIDGLIALLKERNAGG